MSLSAFIASPNAPVGVRNGDLNGIIGSLSAFSRIAVPGLTSMKIARIAVRVQGLQKEYADTRNNLLEELGERDADKKIVTETSENGVSVKIPDDKKSEFEARATAIENDVTEITVKKLTLSELQDLNLPPAALVNILAFIEAE